tara:strand:+ start:536 stop:1027 length:492 start_codon:yes stop_codon:yes gene_type:complete
MNKNNGRINIMGPNTGDIFELYNKNPMNTKSTSYKNALMGNQHESILSQAFFSAENITIIQNAIKAGVYHLSKGKHVIGNQNEDTLKIIMRSTFLQFSSNRNDNITGQISDLNQLVVDYSIPQINSEADAYKKYKYDVSNLAVPLDRPKSTYHNNALFFKGFF